MAGSGRSGTPSRSGKGGRRLLRDTRSFLGSAHWQSAVTLGWEPVARFGINPHAPLIDVGGQGPVTGLALSKMPGCFGRLLGFVYAHGDVGEGLVDLVDQEQAQIAGLRGGPRAVSMAENSPRISSIWVVRRALARPSRSNASTSPSARPRWHMVLIENHLVEGLAEDLRLLAEVASRGGRRRR